MPGYSAVMQQL